MQVSLDMRNESTVQNAFETIGSLNHLVVTAAPDLGTWEPSWMQTCTASEAGAGLPRRSSNGPTFAVPYLRSAPLKHRVGSW